jgi:hypothetical protein
VKRSILIPIGLAIAVLIGFYLHGSFDRALSGIGLNHHECARNGFGATFCGKELDQYRQRIRAVKETAAHAVQEGQQTIKRETEERHHEEERTLEAKISQERRLVESEPQGSYAYDLAKDEYESARSQLQQLQIGP